MGRNPEMLKEEMEYDRCAKKIKRCKSFKLWKCIYGYNCEIRKVLIYGYLNDQCNVIKMLRPASLLQSQTVQFRKGHLQGDEHALNWKLFPLTCCRAPWGNTETTRNIHSGLMYKPQTRRILNGMSFTALTQWFP